MNKWISVKSAYPDFNHAVLITDGVNIAHARRRSNIVVNFWEIVSSNHHEPERNVTHWMPLPNLPEKQSNNVSQVRLDKAAHEYANSVIEKQTTKEQSE